MNLKSFLHEYLEEKSQLKVRNYDFLPKFNKDVNLPIEPISVSWSKTDISEKEIFFTRRSDLKDFVNAYLELEDQQGIYAKIIVDDLKIRISSEISLSKKFKEMIDEIANETRGY